MRTKFNLTFICVVLLSICMSFLVSCSNNDNNNNNQEKDPVVISCYLDSDNKILSTDYIDVSIASYNEYYHLNNELHIKLNLLNKQNELIHIQLNDVRIVRESTGSFFNCDDLVDSVSVDIKAELRASAELGFEIPTSIKEEKYYLEFDLNGTIVRFYLYNTPDELLETHRISYSVDGVVVHEELVLHGKTVPTYEWFSEDGLFYCIKWENENFEEFYNNPDNRNSFYTVKEDMIFEGKKKDMLKYFTTSSDRYTFVTSLNEDSIIPPNKTIVVPAEHDGKPIRFSNFFFSSELKDTKIVYIPNTDKMYMQLFEKTKIEEIHFAGTKEEWDALDLDIPSRITIYYNSFFNKS